MHWFYVATGLCPTMLRWGQAGKHVPCDRFKRPTCPTGRTSLTYVLYRDNGKEKVYIGITEKKMDTTMVHWGNLVSMKP